MNSQLLDALSGVIVQDTLRSSIVRDTLLTGRQEPNQGPPKCAIIIDGKEGRIARPMAVAF
jgi:hypothetical protein